MRPALKFGDGAADEIGYDLAQLGANRALVVTDPRVAATGLPARVAEQMRGFGVEAGVFDGVHVEPTDAACRPRSTGHGRDGPWEAFVAVGGGSSIDTAKAVNLLLTNPGELMDYVNAPVGGGRAPVNRCMPLVAVPTTRDRRESTTICVLDVLAQRVKSGISHAAAAADAGRGRPGADAEPAGRVTASAGMDILCHALESYTARAYTAGQRKRPEQRVPYCGANPISDMWSEKALSLLATHFRHAVRDGDDLGARRGMAMAATFAGLGFGNAACTSRTPTPTRSPDRCAGSTRPATPTARRWCHTAWPCR